MRLFSALWPPEPVVDHLNRAFARVGLPSGARPTPPHNWHITLAFYGNDADPAERAGHLGERLAGLRAPQLRLAGIGTFPGVLWIGVEPLSAIDREALRLLAVACGANRKFTAHVSVARWRLDLPGMDQPLPGAGYQRLGRYRGPLWTGEQVLLVASEPARGGSRYSAVHAVPLGHPEAGEQPTGW